MVRVTGEQLQKASGYVRAQARRAPVEVTYHGRPELVVLSVEDYALLRQNRKIAYALAEMPPDLIEVISRATMGPEHADLDGLMDE
ncbi:MAG: type II toxin-antitoxin system prevent-host-death family antitoxin [Caulobacteraceae bacterium]